LRDRGKAIPGDRDPRPLALHDPADDDLVELAVIHHQDPGPGEPLPTVVREGVAASACAGLIACGDRLGDRVEQRRARDRLAEHELHALDRGVSAHRGDVVRGREDDGRDRHPELHMGA